MSDQTPIYRATNYIITKPRKGARTYHEYARDAFDSIDTEALVDAIAAHLAAASGWPGRGDKMRHNAVPIAQAVKHYLTGNPYE